MGNIKVMFENESKCKVKKIDKNRFEKRKGQLLTSSTIIIQDLIQMKFTLLLTRKWIRHFLAFSLSSLFLEKTDIWSLGCLLYALMYFKSPFDR